jgi:TIR domain
MTEKPTPYINIYISSSTTSEDRRLLRELESQLSALTRKGNIHLWSKQNIAPGADWQHTIATYISQAHLILLLLSPDFLRDDECHNEMKLATRRMNAGEAHVIPIIMRPADWENTDIGKLRPLPTDREPVSSRAHPEQALYDIVQEIQPVIENIRSGLTDNTSSHAPRPQPDNAPSRVGESGFASPAVVKPRPSIGLISAIVIALMIAVIVSGALAMSGLFRSTPVVPETPTASSITPQGQPSNTDPAASSIITTIQMASAIDKNSKQPTTLTTSFRTNTDIYTTFRINLKNVDISQQHAGYVQAKYYREHKRISTTHVLTISNNTLSGDSFPPFQYYDATTAATVEVYWCREKNCEDAKLAQTASFTVS